MTSSAHYLVELDRPSDGWLALQGASSRARRAADALQEGGASVRFLRAIYIPEDDTCFFLIEAESAALVDEVGRRSEVRFRRITEPVDGSPEWRRAARAPAYTSVTLGSSIAEHQSERVRAVPVRDHGFTEPSATLISRHSAGSASAVGV